MSKNSVAGAGVGPYASEMGGYEPRMHDERVGHLRRWHHDASTALHAVGDHDVEYLGLTLHVPAGVFPPAPMSRLLGEAVSAEVGASDRVLDMGTGSGVNAILAAQQGAEVLAVDINPAAVEAAAANVERCGVANRVEVRAGDLFDGLHDRFDVVVYDPPFRWFPPIDMLERAFTDSGYETLERFFAQVSDHLAPGGRVLMFFGTTGDIDHFHRLAARNSLDVEALDNAELRRDGATETYWAFRLCAPRSEPVLGHRPATTEEMPALVAGLSAGERVELVWKNQLGGLTYEVGTGPNRRFVKWTSTALAHELTSEAERLRWAQRYTPVPSVLDLRTDEHGAALTTTPLPGLSAVDKRWLASPEVAVRAIGEGLRALHDRLPVEDCPFSWSAEDRAAHARHRLDRGELVAVAWHSEHQHLDPAAAVELVEDVPPIDQLVVCHGDACAPNTLVDDGSWSGHVDLGTLGVADRWADLAVATWSTLWNYGPGWEDLLLDAYGVDNDPLRMSYYRLLWDLT